MKHLLFSLLLCGSISANAQDTIYYLKEAPIVVKLEEINPGKVKYKIWDYPNGPSYIAPRRDIVRITSADGKVLWVNEKAWEKNADAEQRVDVVRIEKVRRVYKRNTVTLMPIAFLTNGIGLGVSYEHINRKGNTGIRLPFFAMINYPGAYFTPSVRLYPFGQRIASPFIAPTLLVGYGDRPINKDSLDYYGKTKTYAVNETTGFLGFMIELGVNIHLTRNMFLTVSGGGGVNYPDLAKQDRIDYAGLAKFEVGFGYRF